MTYSEQLERETESCREQLADTLDELRMRMTPGEVVDQLVDYAQDTTGGLFFENLKKEVTRNPLPVALMGAGFLWLMCGKAMNGSRLRQSAASLRGRGREWLSESSDAAGAAQRDAARRLDETASRAREAAGAALSGGRERMRAGTATVNETASEATSQVSGAMSDAAARTKAAADDAAAWTKGAMDDAAARTKDATARLGDAASAAGAAFGDAVSETYDRTAASAGRAASAIAGSASKVGSSAAASGRDIMDFCCDQPLVVAGLGLAVGAAVGAMLPRTRAEDQFMGDLSDQLKQQTKEFAGEQLDKAKTVGEHAYDAAQHEAERQGLSAEAAASEAASRVEDTSIAPSDEKDAASEQTGGGEKRERLHERQ